MKKKTLISLILSFAIVFVGVFCASLYCIKSAFAQDQLSPQVQSIVDAFKVQASHRIATGDITDVDADSQSVINEADKTHNLSNNNYPSTFDLRNCDLDGNGQNKNYVTSVKFQNPWGSCWAFAGTAASETSILAKLHQNSWYVGEDGNKHDSLDLSEHHLAWFNYTPMTAQDNPTQAGEGAYSVKEEKAKADGNPWWQSQRMATGGVCLSTTTSYANGMGVVIEPDANDPNVSPVVRQLLYRGINGTESTTSKGYQCYSKDDDWSIDNALRYHQDYELNEGNVLPNSATFDEKDVYDIDHAKYVTGLMKSQLVQGRALNIAFKADTASPDQPEKPPKYINTDTWAHYTWEKVGCSHDVTVVGWDDNYPVTNFLQDKPLPPENGAWIVKNSWGSKDSIGQGLNISNWGIEGSGYFYLSYYDQSLKSEEAYDYNVDVTNSRPKIIHQNDYMTCEHPHAIEKNDSVTTANVFCAEQKESLCEISTITSTEKVSLNYKVYLLDSKDQRIDTGKLLCEGNKAYDFKGFHRIKLDKTYTLNKGQYFAVATTQKTILKFLIGTANDYNRDGYDAGLCGDSYYCKAIVNPGESFLYTSNDDTWTDWTVIKAQLESDSGDTRFFTYDNFPIKAYAYPVSAQDISNANIIVEDESYVYDGQEYSPKITLSMNFNTILREGKDYELSGDLKKTDVGEYQIKISGKNSYTGKQVVNWKINASPSPSPSPEESVEVNATPATSDNFGMLVILLLITIGTSALIIKYRIKNKN